MNHHPEDVLDPTRPALVVTYGNTPRKVRPLRRDLVVIGQGRGSDVALVGPDIADAHCVLFRTAEGWRLRDGGSRIGTRLNGKPVQESALCDGDALQVGTFNFRLYLPANAPAAAAGARERRLEHSRRHLARLALALRRRLHRQRTEAVAGSACQAELDQQLRFLREQLRQYEQRSQRLQQAEREVAADRDRLAEEWAALRSRGEQTERALAQRRNAVEAELRRRRAECEERCRDLERRAALAGRAPAARSPAAADPDEAHRLDLRRRELECYARHLRRLQLRCPSDTAAPEAELEELRAENLQLRHLLAQREDAPEAGAPSAREVEQLRAELAAARREVEEKETQIQRLLTERQAVDDAAEGMDVESYEAELAEFRRQLQEDRRGVNEEIRWLRERTVDLDEAARAMEQQLAQERAELQRLRDEVYRELGQAPPGGRDRPSALHRLQQTMAALAGGQPGAPCPAEGAKGGSNGRGPRIRAPRRGGSGSAGR